MIVVSKKGAAKIAADLQNEAMRSTGQFAQLGPVEIFFLLQFLEKLGIIKLTD